MSKFFQALEKAEQARVLQHEQQSARSTDSESERTVRYTANSSTGERLARHIDFEAKKLSQQALQPEGVEEHLVGILAVDSFEAEQYRTLCHLVGQLHKEAGLSVIAVSSPAVGDGKTVTAINLAATLTQTPQARVLLIDLDLRRPAIANYLGIDSLNSRSLEDGIRDPNLSLEDITKSLSPLNFSVVLADSLSITPYDVFKASRLDELIEEARRGYDYIVLDTAPLIPFPDCRLIERFVDGFLVVVAAHKTPRKLLEESIAVVDPEKVIGLVFNSDNQPVFGYSSYYAYSPSRVRNGHGGHKRKATGKSL
jgi:capsular exopolysaccharide synthesis family protein